MVFIWRGFGIVVPIVLLISGWITSYWFQDVRFGNSSYLGWTLLWAGVVLIFAALAALGGNVDDEGNPVEKSQKIHNDFFWLPIWLWSLAFIGFGTYQIYQKAPSGYGDYSAPETTEENSYKSSGEKANTVVEEERSLHFYNCAADSIEIEVLDIDSARLYDFYVQSNSYEYVTIYPNEYIVNLDGAPWDIKLRSVSQRKEAYNDAWMILCAGVDFIMVDVTDVCKNDITEQEVKDIDWMDNVVDRYDGNHLIEPKLYDSKGKDVKVMSPNIYIPQKRNKNQSIYVLIPIDSDTEVSEEFLDKEMIYLSVR